MRFSPGCCNCGPITTCNTCAEMPRSIFITFVGTCLDGVSVRLEFRGGSPGVWDTFLPYGGNGAPITTCCGDCYLTVAAVCGGSGALDITAHAGFVSGDPPLLATCLDLNDTGGVASPPRVTMTGITCSPLAGSVSAKWFPVTLTPPGGVCDTRYGPSGSALAGATTTLVLSP